MGWTNVITLNTTLNTSSMDISLNGAPLTVFNYDHASATVSAPERLADVTTVPADLQQIQDDVYGWISTLVERFHLPRPVLNTPYTVEYKRTADMVEVQCDVGSLNNYNAEWTAATNQIKLKARPAFELSFAEFVEFINLHQRLLDMIGAW